ncbi:hypothetical protein ABZS71_31950 [Streptomyces sp. NPDC005393]|uniref:hypothetical protein n=1 Tax=Streptomyces sp. NPDC005393 TaxID=3157041 RepID=UPI0033B918CD
MPMAGCGDGSGATDGAPSKDAPRLPMARYQPGDDGYKRYNEAQDRLAQRCMVGLGFDDFPLHPKMPGSGVTLVAVAMSTPYGQLDLDHARRWGYGWDPKKRDKGEPDGRATTSEEFAVLYGRQSRKAPKSGCSGQADRRLLKGVKDPARMWTYPSGRERRLEKAAKKDPRVRRALESWAQCVVNKGFKRYKSPEDAFRDKAWGRGQNGNTTRTKREMGTAVADIECKREHDTVGVWSAVLAKRQRAEIMAHKADYEAVRRDLDTLKSNVRSALDG